MPDEFGQDVGFTVFRAKIRQSFNNCKQIANRNPLAQQVLQDLLDSAQLQDGGNQLFDDLGMGFGQIVEEPLGVLSAQQFIGVAVENLG